jgi:hypothetical protein
MDIFPGEAAASGAGGAGRMMGEGWMRRMAGMDLARAAGNAVVHGLGDQVGMAAYFAMGGGASMMALGGTVAIVATIGSRINDWREGIKAAEEEQAKFSAEFEKSAQGYRIMASQTEGFGKLGDSMLSDMKQSRDSAIDAQANLAVAQAEFHAAWINDSAERVRLEFAQKRADTASGADLITGLLFRGPGISNDPLMQSIRGLVGQGGMQDIERARMQQDVGIAQMTEDAITTGADWAANLSAMHSGPLREQLENQAAAVAKRRELLDQEYKDQIEYQRKRQDAGIQVGSDFLKANIGNTGYNLQSDPAYQAQLAATQGAIDLQYQQTQITERENQKRADDDAQTAANRLELQKQDFDLQQQYSLNRTQISGIADSNLRRAAEQREANAETMEKLKLEGYTTEQLDQQRRINDQITLNLEKEVWYQERLFDLEMKRADVEHELAGIQATRTQEQTAFGAANSAWENQRRLDEARGMSRAAQQDQLQVENNQAIDAQNQADFKSQEAAKARTLAADKERAAAMTAQRFGPNSDAARQAANEARTAQDQARQAQLEADGLHQQAIDAGKKWQTDKQALEIEHQRAVQNEIQSTLDASAVAEGRMSRLQAERREFEREHPDERSPAELDRLYAAKKAELDAEFGRSLKEKELQLAERRGWLMPQEADYLRLKLENPDVSDGLLRMMSVLDQLSQGEMSTRYTMGQTDFGALRGGVSFGGGGSMWDPNMAFAAARNAAMGSFGGGDFGAFGGGSFGAFDGGW